MKKALYTLIAVFVFTLICSSLKAQSVDVFFTNDKLSSDKSKVTADVYSSQPSTVIFELRTSRHPSFSYSAAGYKVIDWSNYMSCYVPNTNTMITYMTVNLPQGYSPIEIYLTNYPTVIMLLSKVNGVAASTRPIVFANYY